MLFSTLALGFTAILSSIIVISAKNPVHSVLALVLTYLATCGIMILVEVEFIALLFMIVYVGAIAILFLFVVMMLNIKLEELRDNATRYVPVGLFIGLVFLAEVLYVLDTEVNTGIKSAMLTFIDSATRGQNIEVIGSVIYTELWVWMIIASIILLVAMIGAIVSASLHESEVKRQDIFGQIANNGELTKAHTGGE